MIYLFILTALWFILLSILLSTGALLSLYPTCPSAILSDSPVILSIPSVILSDSPVILSIPSVILSDSPVILSILSAILSIPSAILSIPSVILSGAKDLQHRKVSQQYIDQGCFVLLDMAVNRQSLIMTSVNGYVIPINYYQIVFGMRVLRYGYVIDLSADLKKDSSDFSFS